LANFIVPLLVRVTADGGLADAAPDGVYQSEVGARDSSFHSPPCFCQFIRMARFCGVIFLSVNSCSPTQLTRTIAPGPTTWTGGAFRSPAVTAATSAVKAN